jgi:hypothetical protein
MGFVLAIVLIIGVVLAIGAWANSVRRKKLMAKYGDSEIVDGIMAKRIWQGMTEEQLTDSWGRPASIDQRVFKTKISLTYKYSQSGKNRFRERVKVENGLVVGWSQK